MGKCDKVKTTGLKWNLGNPGDTLNTLEFGGERISTSNEIVDDEVVIEVSHSVLWSTTIKPFETDSEAIKTAKL